MQSRTLLHLAVAASLAAGIAGATIAGAALVRVSAPGWQEIAWPFPRDAWPNGRAFRCGAAVCGGDVEVYVRPKIGFCNCAAGVSGDDEVDAVSDLDMITDDFTPRGPGEPISVSGMAGLTRRYTLHMPDGSQRAAAGSALSHTCDLVVAASQGGGAGSPAAQQGIAALLASPPVAAWLRSLLGDG